MTCIARCLLPVFFALAAGALPINVEAQTPANVRRIYVVSPGFGLQSDEAQGFIAALHKLGYVEGRDVSLDWWYGNGSYEGIPRAIEDIATRKPDIIVVESTTAALAAKRATSTIPIVLAVVGDPVGFGLVESLAHPGGNVTGLTNQTVDLATKRLQFIREAIPKARRVAVFWNLDTPPHKKVLKELEPAARELRFELKAVQARTAQEVDSALSVLGRMNADALMVLDGPFFTAHGSTILKGAAKARVPVVWAYRPFARQGVLIAYSAPVTDLFRRAAGYVDRILKGASPASLPVEQPTRFELVVNLKTAKALGITIPESILLQADEVIR